MSVFSFFHQFWIISLNKDSGGLIWFRFLLPFLDHKQIHFTSKSSLKLHGSFFDQNFITSTQGYFVVKSGVSIYCPLTPQNFFSKSFELKLRSKFFSHLFANVFPLQRKFYPAKSLPPDKLENWHALKELLPRFLCSLSRCSYIYKSQNVRGFSWRFYDWVSVDYHRAHAHAIRHVLQL